MSRTVDREPLPKPGHAPGWRPAARVAWGGALVWALWAAAPAHAGQGCQEGPLTVAQATQGMALAERTARQLDASGAELVLLARAGQDLSRYHLNWSHLGVALREPGAEGQPPVWRVVHKLNTCGTARAQLWRQGLGEFFLDRPHRYEAAFVVPTPEVQARVAAVLRDPARRAVWHQPEYSMVAYPWAQRYQQSNQWALETLAGALAPQAGDRRRAQAWLQFQGYAPTVLRIDAFTRLGARVGMAHIAFDDHPNSERYADRIATVTVDSVFTWLAQVGLAGPMQVIR